jgi:predicted nucleotidyltransferase
VWKSGLKNYALQSLGLALNKALMAPEEKSFVDQLRAKLGLEWTAIREARRRAEQAREKVSKSLTEMNFVSGDTSVVVFGSLARDEFTDESDLDWTLLVDGQADSDHLHTAQAIRKKLTLAGFKEPGRTGVFGNTTFSHGLIHLIGGEDDTNRNTTQRILLLLESRGINSGETDAYGRVLTGVLNRYLEEEANLVQAQAKLYKVPRFLLNDIVRFWRTMAVDFASKQRAREGEDWGLKVSKLSMSRKLIFASGLLVCFGCSLDTELLKELEKAEKPLVPLLRYLRSLVRFTPLELVARASLSHGNASTGRKIFDSYDQFLAMIADSEKRDHLKNVRPEESRTDPLFLEAHDISRIFQSGLEDLFFDNADLYKLTRKYGVF